MKKKTAMKWVKALRSGKYRQAFGTLVKESEYNEDVVGHCCLGVLGEVCGLKNDEVFRNSELLDNGLAAQCGLRHEKGNPINEEGIRLSATIKLKVPAGNRGKKEFRMFDSLADANDQGATFKAIATWIEKNYEKL